jgi:DNA-binding LacI/PurR family transcriptional regulator
VVSSTGRANILDVARHSGVSRTTVSRVLNEPERVPATTVSRVRQAIEELDYKPSPRARSMRTGRSDVIALLVGDVSEPFLGAMAKAVALRADQANLSVILCDIDHSETRLLQFLDQLPRQGVDGIIIATGDDLTSPAIEARLSEVRETVPVVISGRPPREDHNSLSIDFADITYRATQKLIAAGRRQPTFLAARSDQSLYLAGRFVEGYRAAMKEHGLDPRILGDGPDDPEAAELLRAALGPGSAIDALVTVTVMSAMSAIRVLGEAGLSIPGDVAIIACEDVPLADATSPPVTTLGVSPADNGRLLVDLLASHINGTPREFETPLPALVERATT